MTCLQADLKRPEMNSIVLELIKTNLSCTLNTTKFLQHSNETRKACETKQMINVILTYPINQNIINVYTNSYIKTISILIIGETNNLNYVFVRY